MFFNVPIQGLPLTLTLDECSSFPAFDSAVQLYQPLFDCLTLSSLTDAVTDSLNSTEPENNEEETPFVMSFPW